MEQFSVYYDDRCIASYYCEPEENSYEYYVGWPSVYKNTVPAEYLKEKKLKKPYKLMESIMKEENRLPNTRKIVYVSGPVKIVRVPKNIDRFIVYRMNAQKGECGYSEKKYSALHYEGENTPKGMKEWASFYQFVKRDDGTFEVELEENWWWGGGHNDGGTIHCEVPEEYLDMSYDEFLQNVVTVGKAANYGFTADDLRGCSGLKEFFGFE